MRKLLILFMVVIHIFGFSQMWSKQIIAIGSIQRMDYFIGGNFRMNKNHWEIGSEITLGSNSTFTQQRFFPRIGITAGYEIIESTKIRLIPEIKTAFSMLNLKTSKTNLHHWQEVYGGFTASLGNKIRFKLAAYLGWINESFNDQFTGRNINFGTLGYEGVIGIGYVW